MVGLVVYLLAKSNIVSKFKYKKKTLKIYG